MVRKTDKSSVYGFFSSNQMRCLRTASEPYAQVRITGVACWKYQVFPFAFMYLEELIQIAKESKSESFGMIDN